MKMWCSVTIGNTILVTFQSICLRKLKKSGNKQKAFTIKSMKATSLFDSPIQIQFYKSLPILTPKNNRLL